MVSGAPEFTARVSGDVAAIEALRTGPYTPPWAGCADPGRSAAGQDYAIVALRTSQDFYAAGDDGENVGAAYEAFETERWGVVLALDERWGPHRPLALDAYAEQDEEGTPVPPFCAGLFELGYYGDLQVWHVDGREVGVGVGQMDQEEPVVLFVLVTASTPVG
ncbi:MULTISPECIES: hypothetical protein [unclassified Streptomyces]|uniref:hypothetical protein n=1 Tax=unclassified Streptomyces TaxID=2593676 RepID=UPI00030F98FD|nr:MULTISPECIES: hypothetical protein [unclassified Streptomyces]MYR68188.1 hypothetical protein [Streptomyces sp. SID4939]MYS03250.1 hypothetical protein [Streptomyces sp. SID4940]MYT66856.1 hypothetical protein [Streptomyces sp. SID8357]MYT88367.1 hypothetical protein [Streptomyces sp. SID8360]MYW39558.1 hypothetical protein [Streptomyces sp. SID1]